MIKPYVEWNVFGSWSHEHYKYLLYPRVYTECTTILHGYILNIVFHVRVICAVKEALFVKIASIILYHTVNSLKQELRWTWSQLYNIKSHIDYDCTLLFVVVIWIMSCKGSMQFSVMYIFQRDITFRVHPFGQDVHLHCVK